MEIKKEYIYLTNSLSLFFTKYFDKAKIAAILVGKTIKSGIKFTFAHPSEKADRDKFYQEFCDELQKQLKQGIK